ECVSWPYENARRLAREADEANKAKSLFLANVSHEFRTPLAVIKGYTELLLLDHTFDARTRKWVQVINRSSHQMGYYIDDLLDMEKAEAGQLTVTHSRITLRSYFFEIIEGFQARAREKDILLHWS